MASFFSKVFLNWRGGIRSESDAYVLTAFTEVLRFGLLYKYISQIKRYFDFRKMKVQFLLSNIFFSNSQKINTPSEHKMAVEIYMKEVSVLTV